MVDFAQYELWFITGSQHLYGEETLENVARHAEEITSALDHHPGIPIKISNKSVVTAPDQIAKVMEQANLSSSCIGVISWMHTFSPAQMWIRGLQSLNKPMLHLHTQYNDTIPWSEIDMDFMNENQSAHGGREFGFMVSRLRRNRKVVVGHWRNDKVVGKIGSWSRAALGWHVINKAKVARFGDNMRQVAVTEGDKVEAQMRFGFTCNGFGIGDLVEHVESRSDQEIEDLVNQYADLYQMDKPVRESHAIKDAAKIELGMRSFLRSGDFQAFTDTFEDLHGLKQLPGIAVQRLMADGYGFGAEGDWKTSALLFAMKAMDQDLEGGTSFMEDYTYDFRNGDSRVLGSHMLEICPSIAGHQPRCEVHPLSIGGKEDPVRLVFGVEQGPAINVSLMDMGTRFRMVINKVDVVNPENDLPKLPVARVLWKPRPNVGIAAQAWILAGGSHHTVFSKAVSTEMMEDFAEMAGIESVVIDGKTSIRDLKTILRWNEVYYHLFQHNM